MRKAASIAVFTCVLAAVARCKKPGREVVHSVDPVIQPAALEVALAEYERGLLTEAMNLAGGVKKRAAQLLSISFRSFRYRHEKLGLDDAGRVVHLLRELEGLGGDDRCARFVCVAALATPDGTVATARGECAGRILDAPRGAGGFGYDPVFESSEAGVAMAELAPAEKNRISHRARAFRGLRDALEAHVRAGSESRD